MKQQPKIAIVHDWLYGGGAEKVVQELHHLYPEAPIYTSYCSDEWRKKLDGVVVTGYLQRWPFSSLRRFLPLLRQWWFARLDLSDYDIILSSSGNGEAKFAQKTRGDQLHICYCHTPTHFYWRHFEAYVKQPSVRPYWLARLGLKTLVAPLRKRDWKAAQNVDAFMANSTAIQADIRQFYGQDSTIVFPPISTGSFLPMAQTEGRKTLPDKPRCIVWGRVVPMKRLDIAIEACNQLGWQLDIIGEGPDLDRLKQLAGPTISFLGFVSDEERRRYIQNADLFLFCSYEDFGVAPVEALAAGLPVVAYKAGGALDYVQDGKNSWFFEEQTADSLVHVLKKLPGRTVCPQQISKSSEQFDTAKFSKKVEQHVNDLWRSHHEDSH